MDIRKLIIRLLDKRGEIKASDIIEATGLSRAYINRFFKKLREEGKIVLLGKANRARYVLATKDAVARAKREILGIRKVFQNKKGLSEDRILDQIRRSVGIFMRMPENVSRILDYAFTEMLNNAIEHSQSKKIEVNIEKDGKIIRFNVVDWGVGIYNNIMRKKKLRNEMEAVQDLLKGKLTTAKEAHTGEGIFFTSKAADMLVIQSSHKKLIFNNLLDDIFIKDIKNIIGTKVAFSIGLDSKKQLRDIFNKFTEGSFEFSKTKVKVKLYKMDTEYISRSQARRIVSGLDKFRTIVLDFNKVKTVGQGFADEIFRVWKARYPKITIIPKNTNENVNFMINRAKVAARKQA